MVSGKEAFGERERRCGDPSEGSPQRRVRALRCLLEFRVRQNEANRGNGPAILATWTIVVRFSSDFVEK
jgi:hypothetical protein